MSDDMDWKETQRQHPVDDVFRFTQEWGKVLTTTECLRILSSNGFYDPVFQEGPYPGLGRSRRCLVTGPDGERHNAGEVLALILRAERLENLCKDRSDAVLGMLRRGDGR